jgi:hypothetical protein
MLLPSTYYLFFAIGLKEVLQLVSGTLVRAFQPTLLITNLSPLCICAFTQHFNNVFCLSHVDKIINMVL